MTDITASRNKIQQESIQFKKAVSENAASVIGGSVNYLIDERDQQEARIGTNETNIATNASNISTNASNIADAVQTINVTSGSLSYQGGSRSNINRMSKAFTFTAPYAMDVVGIMITMNQFSYQEDGDTVRVTSYASLTGVTNGTVQTTDFDQAAFPQNASAQHSEYRRTIFGNSSKNLAANPTLIQASLTAGQTLNGLIELYGNNQTASNAINIACDYSITLFVRKS